jgi:transcriptional regulator with XRE-family HTH domain
MVKIRNQTLDKDGKPLSQAELARQAGTTPQMIAQMEGNNNSRPFDPEQLNKVTNSVERILKHHLRGVKAGEPMLSKREEKELAEKKAAEKKAAREEAKRLKEEEEAKRVKEEEEKAAAAAKEKEEEEKAAEERKKKEAEEGAGKLAGKLGKAKIVDDEDDEDAEE